MDGPTNRCQAQEFFGLRGSAAFGPQYRAIRDKLEPGWREVEARAAAAEAAQERAEEEARCSEERAERRQEARDRELWVELGGLRDE